jgi:hypothetical protein
MKTKNFIELFALGIFILITFSTASLAVTHDQIGEVELTYRNFTFGIDDVCTAKNNWCGKVDFTEKAIVYGTIESEVFVPAGTKEVYVWIHIPCNGPGEGLYGRPGDVALISVDNESKPETIKSSDTWHFGAFYRYDQCESFLNSFNVFGDRIKLKIEMIGDDPRLDLEKVVLKFYDGENKSKVAAENESVENKTAGNKTAGNKTVENITAGNKTAENESTVNESTVNESNPAEIDSDGDGIPDAYDSCPKVAGIGCNHGCTTNTDVDVDGLQEDNENCPKYDEHPYDQDNDGVLTIEDCNDVDPKDTKIKGDDDGDGVSNCIDLCPDVKGDDKYGCPKTEETSKYALELIAVFLAAVIAVILILIVRVIRKKH